MPKTLVRPYFVPPRAIPTRLIDSITTADAGRCCLDGCENDRVSIAALDAVRNARPEHLLLHWDSQDSELRADLAAMYAVDANQVFLCAGAMDAIRTTFDLFGPPARTIGMLNPDWPGFRYFAEHAGAAIVTLQRADFPHQFEVADVAAFCDDRDVDVLIVSNPSAVTGRFWHADEVSELLRSAPGTMFIIDEADSIYPERTSMHLTKQFDNVIFLGSLSKFFGLSGLRVGFVVAPDAIRQALSSTVDRLCLASVALVASRAAIADVEYQRETQRATAENLTRLTAALADGPFFVAPGSECFACYLSADDSVDDPYESLGRLGIDLVPGSLFGLRRGGRLNLRSKVRVDQLVVALSEAGQGLCLSGGNPTN